MLRYGKSTLGAIARPRTAIAVMTAALVLGGTVSEASAKSRHHRHHHKHHHVAKASPSLFDANASIAPSTGGRSFSGVASYYGNESGSRTASGQRFNQNAMTAAHRSLPFGTKLRVTNVASGQSVTVRVNDRGPFVRGRVVDVSYAAAETLGMVGGGVAKVKLDVVQ